MPEKVHSSGMEAAPQSVCPGSYWPETFARRQWVKQGLAGVVCCVWLCCLRSF